PGSSPSPFGRALHQAGIVGSGGMAAHVAREAFEAAHAALAGGTPPVPPGLVRRGQGVSSAHRLLAARLADVADREAGPLLDVAEGLGDDLARTARTARTARPGARWLLDRHLAAGARGGG